VTAPPTLIGKIARVTIRATSAHSLRGILDAAAAGSANHLAERTLA
jgi:hypothetical protein